MIVRDLSAFAVVVLGVERKHTDSVIVFLCRQTRLFGLCRCMINVR